jgi:Ca-activated chloride channel family protein
MMEKLMEMPPEEQDAKLSELVDALVQKLLQEGYVSFTDESSSEQEGQFPGQGFEDLEPGQVKFELTNKGIDFLGFKALKDLLGSLGKSHMGRHDTRDLSSGIETSGASKAYEFGDTLNLDVSATLLSAVQREGLGTPLKVDYRDLMIHQTEYLSSCATVLMLDCSHSMILYGEDRFTPAKRVAMALSHLIRTQYPGDTLNLVLFHDSAEEAPLSQLARASGSYYTNTRGFAFGAACSARQRRMNKIIMITDGKLTDQEDGRVRTPSASIHVVGETLKEVACRKSASDQHLHAGARADLVSFVKRSLRCAGQAYFTTPYTLHLRWLSEEGQDCAERLFQFCLRVLSPGCRLLQPDVLSSGCALGITQSAQHSDRSGLHAQHKEYNEIICFAFLAWPVSFPWLFSGAVSFYLSWYLGIWTRRSPPCDVLKRSDALSKCLLFSK